MTKLLLIGMLVMFGGLGLDKCTYNASRADTAIVTNGG